MVSNDLFFPIRYEKSRPFIPTIVSLCKNEPNLFSDSFQLKVQNIIFREMVKTEEKYPAPVYISDDNFNLKLSRELNFFWFYHSWQNAGKNIFHFTKELIELFENTDVSEVPLNLIQFPFNGFYISLEEINRTFALDTLGNEYHIDGVFVVKNLAKENQIDLFFNSYQIGAKPTKNWLWGDYASLVGDWYRVNYSVEKTCLKQTGYQPKYMSEYPSEGREATMLFFEEMANIVFNALCYLSTKQEAVVISYPKDAPQNLLGKLENAKTKHQKQVALTELKNRGYNKVHFVGIQYKTERSNHNLETLIAPHWRRGFWRNQAHGTGFKEHTLIWIKPTIVNKDKGEPEKGRIYEV